MNFWVKKISGPPYGDNLKKTDKLKKIKTYLVSPNQLFLIKYCSFLLIFTYYLPFMPFLNELSSLTYFLKKSYLLAIKMGSLFFLSTDRSLLNCLYYV